MTLGGLILSFTMIFIIMVFATYFGCSLSSSDQK